MFIKRNFRLELGKKIIHFLDKPALGVVYKFCLVLTKGKLLGLILLPLYSRMNSLNFVCLLFYLCLLNKMRV